MQRMTAFPPRPTCPAPSNRCQLCPQPAPPNGGRGGAFAQFSRTSAWRILPALSLMGSASAAAWADCANLSRASQPILPDLRQRFARQALTAAQPKESTGPDSAPVQFGLGGNVISTPNCVSLPSGRLIHGFSTRLPNRSAGA